MRIPIVDKLLLLLRPRAETEYERIMLLHGLEKGGSKAASWGRFGLVAVIALLLTGAQSQVDEDLHCLALTVYFEARGEPENGQIAVAHVVMNRVNDRRWPGTVCGVVQQGGREQENCQFSWYCDRLSDMPAHRADWNTARALAHAAYWAASEDPTGGALWYHAVYVKPIWRRKLARWGRIGTHIFYLDPARQSAGA